MFAIIGGAAWLLGRFTDLMLASGLPYFPVGVLCQGMEYLIFFGDTVCFMFFVGAESYTLICEIIANVRNHRVVRSTSHGD